MPAKLLAIGLDSVNATLLERWADQGHLPNFARLRTRSAAFRLAADCMETLPGAIWSDIIYGQDSAQHGLYFHPEQIALETGLSRRVPQTQLHPERLFWHHASGAGRRCAVIDVPFMPLVRDPGCLQVREYAIHDISYGYGSEPASLAAELAEKHSLPHLHAENCDMGCGGADVGFVYRALLDRAGCKTELLCDLLGREQWDMFFAVYGETHCASHYLWPSRTKTGALHLDIEGMTDCWEPLRALYRRVDCGLGRLLEEAGADASVILFTSHGVGPYYGGPQLLSEFLRRLGLSDGWDWPGRRHLRNLATALRREIPLRMTGDLPLGRGRSMSLLRRLLGIGQNPGASARTQAFAMLNNRIGAIRLNLAGRDPFGKLNLDQAKALSDRLIRELEQLHDPRSGKPIVKSVRRTADIFGTEADPVLPDLLVKFSTTIGAVERCWSRSIGHIHVPNNRPYYRRTGDHVPQSRAWVKAKDYPPASRGRGNVLDIAPTILDLAGVDLPAHMTGVALRSRLDGAG